MTPTEAFNTNPNAILVHSGVLFDVFNPTQEDIFIEDIAHALSNLCRYGGHSPKFYSVAQHSVFCSLEAGTLQEQFDALMHDATEAYLIDLPRPIKRNIPKYIEIENVLQEKICQKYELTYPLSHRTHEVDNLVLQFEYTRFYDKVDKDFNFWSPEISKEYFLRRYDELKKAISEQKLIIEKEKILLRKNLSLVIRDVSDFPKPGVLFKDITPVLYDSDLCSEIVNYFHKIYIDKKIDAVVGIESRGFFFGFLLASKLGVPFIPIRKPGKLPFTTVSIDYDLEYGSGKIEMNSDAIQPGMNVLVHDDLLATGGTAAATAELIKRQGGNISGFCFVINLAFLNGSEKLKPYSENIEFII